MIEIKTLVDRLTATGKKPIVVHKNADGIRNVTTLTGDIPFLATGKGVAEGTAENYVMNISRGAALAFNGFGNADMTQWNSIGDAMVGNGFDGWMLGHDDVLKADDRTRTGGRKVDLGKDRVADMYTTLHAASISQVWVRNNTDQNRTPDQSPMDGVRSLRKNLSQKSYDLLVDSLADYLPNLMVDPKATGDDRFPEVYKNKAERVRVVEVLLDSFANTKIFYRNPKEMFAFINTGDEPVAFQGSSRAVYTVASGKALVYSPDFKESHPNALDNFGAVGSKKDYVVPGGQSLIKHPDALNASFSSTDLATDERLAAEANPLSSMKAAAEVTTGITDAPSKPGFLRRLLRRIGFNS